MKKFFLLMALAFLAGAVNAQNTPNFGARANLKQAVKFASNWNGAVVQRPYGANDPVPTYTYTENGTSHEVTCYSGWDQGEKKLYWSGTNNNAGTNVVEFELFSQSEINDFLRDHNTSNLLDVVDNFVILTDYSKNWKRYYGTENGTHLTSDPGSVFGDGVHNSAVSYSVCFYTYFNDKWELVGKMNFWNGDVMIAPLRALRGAKASEGGNYFQEQLLPDNVINDIRRVTVRSNSHDGQVYFKDAYFISAIPELDFKDKDGVDIGNAYIDPSYLIPSNRLSVNIHSDRSFDIVTKAGTESGTLHFSLPYPNGIDMSDVSFHQIDFDRTLNVFSRYIVENKIIDLSQKLTMAQEEANVRLVRKLYNSRYSGAFYDEGWKDAIIGGGKARQHVNNIYWETYAMQTNEDRSVWVQDICLTKNRIEARPTRKGLEASDWADQTVWGFRNRDYIVQPYYISGEGPHNTEFSDVVRGDWDQSHMYNYTDLSKYNRMRIIGSPKTKFDIRYATELDGTYTNDYPNVKEWKTFTVQTDARSEFTDSLLKYKYAAGEVVIDLDYLKAKDNSEHLYLQAVIFNGINGKGAAIGQPEIIRVEDGVTYTYPPVSGLRDKMWCNNIELYEGEGRLVDLHGSADPTDTENMFHQWNNDNNYQWQYGTVVRWAAHGYVNVNDDNTQEQNNFQQLNYSEESPVNCSSGQLIWGANGMYAENYADLTGYKKLRIYGDSGSARIVLNVMRNGNAPHLNTTSSYLKNNGADEQRVEKDIAINSSKGYAELDLSNYEYVHLNGIKVSWGSTITGLKSIKLVEDEESSYIFYGNGSYGEQGRAPISESARMASNDLTATVIDSRARCNNMQVPYPAKYPDGTLFFDYVEHITLPQTASQNVLMIARNDQFNRRKIGDHVEYQTKDGDVHILYDPSNPIYGDDRIYYDNGEPLTKIVDDVEDFNILEVTDDPSEAGNYYTCTNLKLVDGLSFYAPKEIKAGTATYTRTFNNNNKAVVNTIVLPFKVNAGSETAKKSAGFYVATNTLKSVIATADDEKNKVGILGEQDVKEGDWLLQFRKCTGTADANVPYLYAVAEGTGEKVFEGVAENGKVIIPETPDVTTPAETNMSNYDDSFTEVNGERKEGYYLRGVYEGTCMEDILFYGANGTLYRTPRMTVTPFRTIIHSPIPVTNTSYEADQDAYFGVSSANNVKVVLAYNPDDDQAVAIENVEVDGLFAEDAPIYNVAGQRVNTLEKGIYIVAGKKILVK